MSDFVRKPLLQQLNKDNPITRIEKLESGNNIKTSAIINDVSELSSNLGEMTSGQFNFYNPTTGQLVGYLSSVPLPNYPSYYFVMTDSAGNVQFSVDPSTSGATTMGNGNVTINESGVIIANGVSNLAFKDTAGNSTTIFEKSTTDNILNISNDATGGVIYIGASSTDGGVSINATGIGGYVKQTIKLTDTSTPYIKWAEHASEANTSTLQINAGAQSTQVTIGGTATPGATIRANLDGTETVFNETSYDIDFRIEGATNTNLFKLDAGLDAIGIGKAATSDNLMDVNGSINLVTGNTYKINGTAHTHNYTDTIAAFWNSVTIPASTTYYGAPFKVGVDATGHQVPWAEGGVLSDMSIRISSNQPASGSLVCTLQVNGSDTSVVATVAAGTVGPATSSDTTHTASISATDTLRWKVVNNATGASAALTSATMLNTKATV